MTEQRIQNLEQITIEHSQELRGVHAALHEITETMKAFARGIVDLQTGQRNLTAEVAQLREQQSQLILSQRSLIEAQRDMANSIERLSNTMTRLATEAAQDRAAIREMQAEVRQIWQYLLDQRNNGHSE